MEQPDPFAGYSLMLRILIFVVTPAFLVYQFVRLRRALHVFQLEGYKRTRFARWCRTNRRRALFLRRGSHKKPLVMTGRAWRVLLFATAISGLAVLGLAGVAHVQFGFPADIVTWALAAVAVFVGASLALRAADFLLTPVQTVINNRYLTAARRKLGQISPLVVGVTGSYGKTSTKFAIAGLMPQALATPGSYNTPLGVCRTINEQLGANNRAFIVEMGAYGRGEIAELCRFVKPRIGVLTAIGPVHLERFGSLEAIRQAKYEIVENLPQDGTAVMNVDDPDVRVLADRTSKVKVVRYGLDPAGRPDVTATEVATATEGSSFSVVVAGDKPLPVKTALLGEHSVRHVLAAVAVAKLAGRSQAELKNDIEALRPVEHRLQLIQGAGGVTVIDDAYNSNPAGAAAALDVLAAMPATTRVVVTPGIVELGELADQENRRLGEQAGRVADVVVVVAEVNRASLVAGLRDAGGAGIIEVENLAEATERLRGVLRPGAVVLFENDLPDHYEN